MLSKLNTIRVSKQHRLTHLTITRNKYQLWIEMSRSYKEFNVNKVCCILCFLFVLLFSNFFSFLFRPLVCMLLHICIRMLSMFFICFFDFRSSFRISLFYKQIFIICLTVMTFIFLLSLFVYYTDTHTEREEKRK